HKRWGVNSLTGTLDGPGSLDPDACVLSGEDGGTVGLTVAASVVNGQTVAVLTFAGPDVVGGSLADGSYTLTVLADHVHDRWGRELDGDGDGSAGGNRVGGFSRLFGDSGGRGGGAQLGGDFCRAAFGT